MAADDDDPYVKAGRAFTSGKKPEAAPAEDDPYVQAGRAVTSAAATTADVPYTAAPAWGPDWIPPTVRSFGSGLVQGTRDVAQTIAGWERQANEAVPALAAIDRFTGTNPGRAENLLAGQTKEFEKEQGDSTAASVGRIGGNIGLTTAMLPVGPAGKAATWVAERAVPWAANLVRGVTEGAVAGGGTSALVSGPSGENPLAAAGEGALTGGVIGGAMPLVRAGISALSGSTGRALRGIADRLGIELSTGQEVGGIAAHVEDASKIIPGSGAARAASTQNGQIAGAIAREAGIPGKVEQLTTPMLNTAEGRIGTAIEGAARRIDVPGDSVLLDKLGQIETAAGIEGAKAPQAIAARKLIDRILTTMSNRGGSMPGADFQRFIQRGDELEAAINSGNRDVAKAARAIKEALFDAAERSGSTGVADLQAARYQYKVVKTVRDAIDKTVDGSESVSQAKLAQLIRGNFDMTRTGAGNNMQDLARLLDGIKPLRSSGTAERLAMYGALGVTGGGGAYYFMQHPDEFENFLSTAGPAAATTMLAGRAARLGPGLGLRGSQLFDPVVPRVAGALNRPPPKDNALAPP